MHPLLKFVIGILAVIGAATVAVAFTGVYRFKCNDGGDSMPPLTGGPQQIGCTMEAKICPDGSVVGRSGPRCEFAPCPVVSATNEAIRVTSPLPDETVTVPITVKGEARGTWFFEGSFPVSFMLSDGRVIAGATAEAKGEWMTEDFVPFEAVLVFPVPAGMTSGSLILSKDNPSGLPENDAKVVIPVKF
jgi:hypothetical protein